MVSIIKRRKARCDYYYLYHDSKGVTRRQHEEYLGKHIPPDVDARKNNFLMRILRGEWEPKLRAIRDNFARERDLMPQTALKKSLDAFTVKFTYSTQKIEGSTLSLKDTELLLRDGITPASKPSVDVREAEAHRTVFLDAIREENMSESGIIKWHRRLFEDTKKDIAGNIRDCDVRVGQSKFIPPPHSAVGPLLGAFFEWYETDKKTLNPVELAALIHLKFVTIHPFGDGNGRVSRIMMNHVLYGSGYPLMDILYKDRRSYYNALEKSQVGSLDWTFLRWFMRRYLLLHAKYQKRPGDVSRN